MGNTVGVPAQVRLDHLRVPKARQAMNLSHGIQGTAIRPVGVLLRRQIGLEDRLQDQEQSSLHHPVLDRGNPQRSLFAIRLGYPYPSHRLRLRTVPSLFSPPLSHPPLPAQL